MAINKVVLGDTTLLDLTRDTVTPATLLAGVIAHNAAGEEITGALSSSVDPYGALEATLTN